MKSFMFNIGICSLDIADFCSLLTNYSKVEEKQRHLPRSPARCMREGRMDGWMASDS